MQQCATPRERSAGSSESRRRGERAVIERSRLLRSIRGGGGGRRGRCRLPRGGVRITFRDMPAIGARSRYSHISTSGRRRWQLYGFSLRKSASCSDCSWGSARSGPSLPWPHFPQGVRASSSGLVTGDAAVFASVPGIGRKTASVYLESRTKVVRWVSGGVVVPAVLALTTTNVSRACGPPRAGVRAAEADKLLARVESDQTWKP